MRQEREHEAPSCKGGRFCFWKNSAGFNIPYPKVLDILVSMGVEVLIF